MKPITLETTVGELIPEGKICAKCKFRFRVNGVMWCFIRKKRLLIRGKPHQTWVKFKSCPKPPSEVKK